MLFFVRRFRTFPALKKASKSSVGPLEVPRPKYKRDVDSNRGYKFEAELNLHSYLERSGPLGLGGGEAEGFKSRDMRTGSEPPSPEEIKQTLNYFKSREKPPSDEKVTPLRDLLMGQKKGPRRHQTFNSPESGTASILKRHRASQLQGEEHQSVMTAKNMQRLKLANMAKARLAKRAEQQSEDGYKRGHGQGSRARPKP